MFESGLRLLFLQAITTDSVPPDTDSGVEEDEVVERTMKNTQINSRSVVSQLVRPACLGELGMAGRRTAVTSLRTGRASLRVTLGARPRRSSHCAKLAFHTEKSRESQE
jgi:hypothetical protein